MRIYLVCGDADIANFIRSFLTLVEKNSTTENFYHCNKLKSLIDDLGCGCVPPPDLVIIAGQDMITEHLIPCVKILSQKNCRVVICANLIGDIKNYLDADNVKRLTLHSATDKNMLLSVLDWAKAKQKN